MSSLNVDKLHDCCLDMLTDFVLCDIFLISKPTGPQLKSYTKRQYVNCEKQMSYALSHVKNTLGSDFNCVDDIVFTSDDFKKIVDGALFLYVESDGDVDCLPLDVKHEIEFIYNNVFKSEIEKLALYVPPIEANIERQKLSNKMRYNVLKRDGFRCCLCGATGATTELVVDHIRPVSYGGKTVMSNLQTLCFECNNGKSDDFDLDSIKDESYV